MNKVTYPNTFFVLTIVGIGAGVLASIMGSEVLGLSSMAYYLTADILAVMTVGFIVAEIPKIPRPPRPKCPPLCPGARYWALGAFILAVLAELFFSGSLVGVSALDFLMITFAFSILSIGGSMVCPPPEEQVEVVE
ncbi:MAG: hypothetical protein BMS9Abin05_2351 [Rhodothermia bacterium]|nr:MAG: hypothetical protein BMS9Abin05_2351 [Rhodothermia bacterium]